MPLCTYFLQEVIGQMQLTKELWQQELIQLVEWKELIQLVEWKARQLAH